MDSQGMQHDGRVVARAPLGGMERVSIHPPRHRATDARRDLARFPVDVETFSAGAIPAPPDAPAADTAADVGLATVADIVADTLSIPPDDGPDMTLDTTADVALEVGPADLPADVAVGSGL